LNIGKKNYNKMFGAQNWAPYFYEIKLIRVMKKTVQIVTIPLNKEGWNKGDLIKLTSGYSFDGTNWCLAGRDKDSMVEGNWQAQQLLVLSDDEIQINNYVYWDNRCLHVGGPTALSAYKGYASDAKKVIASYPQLEGTLPISKETVQAWIDAGTPGEGSVDMLYWCKNGDSLSGCEKQAHCGCSDNTEADIDPQGNLLLEFPMSAYDGVDFKELFDCQMEIEGNAPCQEQCEHCKEYYNGKFKFNMPIYTVPSIPTDEEIERKAHNNYTYGYLMPIGSHDRSRYEEKKESYTSGYKQALKDIGHE
jgi:hypothetical protein